MTVQPQHVTDKINKRRVIMYLLVPVIFLLGYFLGDNSHDLAVPTKPAETISAKNDLPHCELEDGSTQDACFHNDGTGDMIVNLDYGRFTYNITQGTMHDWTVE